MFETYPLDHGFEIRMHTDLNNVDLCIKELDLFLTRHDLRSHLFSLALLAREALNNAMTHGNKMQPEKHVFFRLTRNDEDFCMEITDHGNGFAWQEHVHAQSDISRESGRGHEIFSNYATTVQYNESGNHLILEYTGSEE